ncbi:hypothetical protein A1O3_00225 [Capronia epimyces CBS 606.96]|uniref:Retrovirus-related Pol polyprotein from transposon TNT 1-94-like beta-barrel domain-containing protein n=1 Tax=Capronia epimyces CBS 606.96 TaxID=1182542 RepID=W9YPS6_9EURO|nr:uncharacterized protein A1O3_00225 [Capronia epimyces CBS 606.96]EXJ91675.1 hypothetical protein A1O3_00225 [Capronia epimyces CBS 606.96]
MAFQFDPRRDLPPPDIQPSSYYASRRTISYGIPAKKPKVKQCYDWIFSSASNIHVALDRAAFKTYSSFKSYVVTVADQRQVTVRGIGTVEIKIRRAPGAKDSHTVCLENVLHVPDWICNIVSDVCFIPANYEHSWTEFGVNFFVREKAGMRPWGYTENFCGLDRLVLSRNVQGRSPMLEDADREVFSVSLTWPPSQRDKWNDYMAEEAAQDAKRGGMGSKKKKAEDDTRERRLKREVKSDLVESSQWKLVPDVTATMKKQWKSGLAEIDGGLDLVARGQRRMAESGKI